MIPEVIEASKAYYADKIGNNLAAKVEEMDEGIKKAFIADILQLVGVSAVTIIVLIYIISEIVNTMPTPTNTKLNETTTGIIDITSSSFSLGGVALIVIVAGAILFYVSRFGQGEQGGMR